MRKHDSIKKTLLSSVLSVVLCISMLIGTTYAWFSESISYKGTRIQTGTLDAELLMYDQMEGKYVSVEGENIFAAFTENPIEPGEIQVVYLQVKNVGNFALNYNVKVGIFEPEAAEGENGTADTVNSESAAAEATGNEAAAADDASSENTAAEEEGNVSETSENGNGEQAESVHPASILEYAVLQGVESTSGLTGTWAEITARAKGAAGEKASGPVSVEAPVEVFANKVNLPAAEGDTESVQYFAIAICIPNGASMDFRGRSVENLGVQLIAEQAGTAVEN